MTIYTQYETKKYLIAYGRCNFIPIYKGTNNNATKSIKYGTQYKTRPYEAQRPAAVRKVLEQDLLLVAGSFFEKINLSVPTYVFLLI